MHAEVHVAWNAAAKHIAISPNLAESNLKMAAQAAAVLRMERGTGFEPATSCLEGRRSTTELPPRGASVSPTRAGAANEGMLGAASPPLSERHCLIRRRARILSACAD